MKKIALDLDGVVFDSENLYRVYSEIYDIDELHKNSLIDNTKRLFQERYNWSKEISDSFYNTYAMTVLKNANIMTGAEIILPKLAKKYDLVIITARSEAEIKYSQEKLATVGLSNIKIHHSKNKKIETFLEEKVDYVIDDDENICREAAKNNIVGLYFKNAASDKIDENEYLKVVNN